MSEKKLDTVITAATETPNSRRKFLGSMGLMGAGAVLASCGPALAQPPASTKRDVDAAILNFALNLEYLEAAFYAAAVGRIGEVREMGGGMEIMLPADLPAGGMNFGPIVSSAGTTLVSAEAVREYAREIADDEIRHVRFLRKALGANAVERPRLNLTTSFSTAGSVASNQAITGFNPYASSLAFLLGAFIFEDVGVTAYKGAAPLMTNADFLSAAAGILAVEAYHAAEIRTVLYNVRDVTVGAGLNTGQVVQAISNTRDALDNRPNNAADTDQGIVSALEGNPEYVRVAQSNIVLADENAIAFSRTPRQVANIVQLNADAKNLDASFFPAGLSVGKFGADFTFLLSL
ncbi:ferritin-like domain-containing protein [Deinococcus peraridilitoris]|uniref:Ferritin-like domain-containing protein n=1 Tax=Deinococcus peraridilitoris (strain DSM 19664 / LMG 22246 / CIP 109416 / KR-200) TaxID=937777 RepID=K9ZZV4_DEIPD|nr:ferritin-like domain-containing protein [Deinococcus peraridilitoris]AFZ67153.1 hypothetical protein Deipe_1614 [Deinococcus peraridilitoris DSM 19664]